MSYLFIWRVHLVQNNLLLLLCGWLLLKCSTTGIGFNGANTNNCRIAHILGILLAVVVQTLDSTIHRINIYPMDSAIGFPNTYLLDSDLSGG